MKKKEISKFISYTIFAFSVFLLSVSASHADGVDIYNDLGSGQEYASPWLYTPSDVGVSVPIVLSQEAIDDINSSAGVFGVGLSFLEPFPPLETVTFGAGTLDLNGSQSIAASDQGTYRQDGVIDPAGPTFIGLINSVDFNAFYLFDLTIFAGTATSATLNLFVEGIDSPVGALVFNVFDVNTLPSPVPEPSTMLLFATGLVGLVGVARRKIK